MADDVRAGRVVVPVVPDGSDFWTRFRAETAGQAPKVGDDLGNAMGKRIADQIAKGIRDGLGKSGKEPATRSGTESGGAFADAFKRRVDAALKSLPKINVDADTSPADRRIAEIRARLAELSSKTVGVNLNAGEARTELASLTAELERLGSRSPNVQVRADVASAAAELAAFNGEVDRIDGRTANVDVDTSRAVGNISNLVAAGITLGPAIVPAAAAAAAAIAGIGPAAIGALGGLGVLVGALSGVVGAVKAMGAAEDASAQSGVSLAKNSFQQASALDAVRSARASLANTTANAAAAADRAEQRVTDAVRSETTAQQALLRAQQAINDAREAARRSLEDLAAQQAHLALDQRKSALDIAKAEQDLAKAKAAAVQSNTAANRQAVAEAQLAYDEQIQRSRDLSTEQKRLAADKAEADRKGVDGSKQVVAAQDQIRQAQEKVRAAGQAVAEARQAQDTQARQSAFSIAQANQAVIAAQRGVQAATVSAGTAGGAAMLKLNKAMEDLSPQGREFSAFIYGLKAPLLDLRRTAEAGVLPGVEDGIKSMLTVLPTALTLVGRFSTSVGNLARSAGAAFAQPYWVNFATDLTNTAIPAMETTAKVAYNLAIGVSGLVHAFLPLSDDIGGGLLKFSRDFAQYGLTLENTAGYRAFLDYVRTVGPEVAHTVGEVALAVARIVQAAAPVGGVTLTSIRLLAEAINSLPVPVLTALVAGIVGVTTATKALSFTRLIGETNTFAGAQLLLSQATGGFRTGLASAGPEVGRFGTALAGMKGGAKGAVDGIGGLLGMVGLGGPLGIGLAAGAVLIASWANAHQAAAAKIAKHKSAVDEINGAIKANSGLIDENVRKVAAKNALDTGALGLAQKIGISLSDVTNAYIHGGTAVDALTGQIDSYIVAEQKATQTDSAHSTQHTTNIKTARELRQTLVDQKDAVAANTSETARNAEKQRLLDEAMKATGNTASQNLTPAQLSLGQALRVVADASKTATDRADALRAADDAVFGATRNAITAEQDQALVLLQVAAAGKANADQQMFGKATLDLHSEASIRNRQMLEQRFLALGQQYLADVQSGVAVDAASKKHDTNRDSLIKAATAAGFDKDEVNKLSNAFGTLPTDPRVQVTVLGVAEAMNKLETAQIAEFGLRNGLDPAEARRQWNQQKDPLHRAEGGAVFGPGGPTDDRIPAWLSNGEHVLTAAEVQAAGGHSAVEAFRKRLVAGERLLPPGYATGGPVARPATQPHLSVEWPFNFPLRVKIPPPASVGGGGQSFGQWPASPAAQRGDSGVWHRVVDLIRSTGPLSGAFGNAYRPGDPLWHGSGRAVDWMGFNQDALATFLAARRPLELIHRTGQRDYAYTRGVNKGSFNNGLMEEHRNHIHIAFARGGPVERVGRYADGGPLHLGHYDSGGILPPGLTIARNDTGTNEFVFTGDQLASLGGRGAQITQHIYPQPGQSEPEIAAMTSRQLAWELR